MTFRRLLPAACLATLPVLAEPSSALAKPHAAGVDEALFIRIAHDVSPRAMSSRNLGYVQPHSWCVDLRLPYVQ